MRWVNLGLGGREVEGGCGRVWPGRAVRATNPVQLLSPTALADGASTALSCRRLDCHHDRIAIAAPQSPFYNCRWVDLPTPEPKAPNPENQALLIPSLVTCGWFMRVRKRVPPMTCANKLWCYFRNILQLQIHVRPLFLSQYGPNFGSSTTYS
jgi:hypothetical protein